jgi:hypothetical protein
MHRRVVPFKPEIPCRTGLAMDPCAPRYWTTDDRTYTDLDRTCSAYRQGYSLVSAPSSYDERAIKSAISLNQQMSSQYDLEEFGERGIR